MEARLWRLILFLTLARAVDSRARSQPRYVGFSTGTGEFVTSSREAGRDMVTFLRGWLGLFPEHSHRSLIFASESYGGHYVPAWVAATLDANAEARTPAERLPLVGLFLGNALVNNSVQESPASWRDFCLAEGIVPPHARPQTDDDALADVEEYLGYAPNMYDYRLESQEGCGAFGYDYKHWAHTLHSTPYREALNVCGDAGSESFGGCAGGCHPCIGGALPFDHHDTFGYSDALSRALREGIKLTLVFGKNDMAVPYVGGSRMAMETLVWEGAASFRAAPLVPLYAEGTIEIGQMRTHGPLTYMQIEDSGHMVPADNPVAGMIALKSLLRGDDASSVEASQLALARIEGRSEGALLGCAVTLLTALLWVGLRAGFRAHSGRSDVKVAAEEGSNTLYEAM